MLGGVLADLLKPAEIAALPADVQDGVRLHRRIEQLRAAWEKDDG